MPNLEIEGTLVRVMPVQKGTSARGEWAKQEFVIEYQEGKFPTNACLSVWGQDKVDELARFKVGDQLTVAFNISSREYQGRWYTDIRAWRITAKAAPQPAYQQPMDIPAGFAPSVPPPTVEDMPMASDDLPF